ncbi:hypothetical protein [Cytobacillus stercorigallinarum]|nr:hypothetical protein [Cytobacillus stercorigallinarum]
MEGMCGMEVASESLDIYKVNKDSQFYYLLSELFDPEDNSDSK